MNGLMMVMMWMTNDHDEEGKIDLYSDPSYTDTLDKAV